MRACVLGAGAERLCTVSVYRWSIFGMSYVLAWLLYIHVFLQWLFRKLSNVEIRARRWYALFCPTLTLIYFENKTSRVEKWISWALTCSIPCTSFMSLTVDANTAQTRGCCLNLRREFICACISRNGWRNVLCSRSTIVRFVGNWVHTTLLEPIFFSSCLSSDDVCFFCPSTNTSAFTKRERKALTWSYARLSCQDVMEKTER
jgi:hypothetical protein